MAEQPPPQRRKVVVEVQHALDLMPKDGEGSCSAYVEVELAGQRRRTKTCPKQVNPTWHESLEFLLASPSSLLEDPVQLTVFHDGPRRPHFLGRLSIPPSAASPSATSAPLLLLPLHKRRLFSSVRGSLALKFYYHDELLSSPPADPPPPPPEPAEPPAAAAAAAAAAAPPPTTEPPADPPPPPPPPPPPSFHADHHHHHPIPPPHHPPPPLLPPPIPSHDPFPVRRTTPSIGHRTATYDLVERMYYLFVRVVKARHLPPRDILLAAAARPFVSLHVGRHAARTRTAAPPAAHPHQPEWQEVFAFAGWEGLREGKMEASVWEQHEGEPSHRDYVGGVVFDLKEEVPRRLPPDSPLAPQWYRLEPVRGGGRPGGELMLAVWVGTQADETFADAWQSDNAGNIPLTRAKVYLAPKLWYLRVTILEAQDLRSNHPHRYPDAVVSVRLGFQNLRSRPSRARSSANPFWGDDLILVAAEPFHDQHLHISVLDRVASGRDDEIGHALAPISDIERRLDSNPVGSKWFNLISDAGAVAGGGIYRGRLHLRLCFDGGYHVMDETAQLSSDFRPSARQLWRPPIGVLELGILRAQGLLPMKTRLGRGATDAYCVAKYGPKWVRTRTIVDSFMPRWNEQYTWEVYDPCTVLTLGVFDNFAAVPADGTANPPPASGVVKTRDTCIGKVRIRISNLQSDRIYTHSYPLVVLHPSGAKKMGEVELAIRFSAASMVHLVTAYALPLFPPMHHLLPFNRILQESLRHSATELIILQMVKAEPPLRAEVVRYMLDTQAARWSIRRSKANWKRITAALRGLWVVALWTDDVCRWRNPTTTILVHILFFILVCYPELILPTLFLYMSLIGAWHYRFRPRTPPHMDVRLSGADVARREELDEEFDGIPSSRPPEVVRQRYDHLRQAGYYIQVGLADVAGLAERVVALLSWRDPIGTSIFVGFCLMTAVVLYAVPLQIIILLVGLYFLRHPRFRRRRPPLLLNFFRRLPTLSDRVL